MALSNQLFVLFCPHMLHIFISRKSSAGTSPWEAWPPRHSTLRVASPTRTPGASSAQGLYASCFLLLLTTTLLRVLTAEYGFFVRIDFRDQFHIEPPSNEGKCDYDYLEVRRRLMCSGVTHVVGSGVTHVMGSGVT